MMLSTANLLSPADGSPVVAPTQDMVLGCYYLTMDGAADTGARRRAFVDEEEAILAYQLATIGLHDTVTAMVRVWDEDAGSLVEQRLETTVGRIIFNGIVPDRLRFQNEVLRRAELKSLVETCYRLLGPAETAHLVDGIKHVGFESATRGGITTSPRCN